MNLDQDDTELGTFNDVDLGATYAAQAFIDEDISFPAADSFTLSSGEAMSAPSLRAVASLSIPDAIVKTSANTDLNLEKLYQNTIPISGVGTVSIKGSLIFNEDVTLNADSTVGSLGNDGQDSLPPLSIPDDLILTDATEFSGSPGMK